MKRLVDEIEHELVQQGLVCHDENYTCIADVWKAKQNKAWYREANEYWNACPQNDDGVLNGFACVSPADVQASLGFLSKIFALDIDHRPRESHRALDCGAGIGRVTKHVLSCREEIKTIDLLDQSPKLLEAAPAYIANDAKIGKLLCQGVQDFHSSIPGQYEIIWCQWILVHLTDLDLLTFLEACRVGLSETGILCIKENMLTTGQAFELDPEDSSITRCEAYYKLLFQKAKWKIVFEMEQQDFPDELMPVKMYALVPDEV